jgi:hypothetical protein
LMLGGLIVLVMLASRLPEAKDGGLEANLSREQPNDGLRT